MLKYQVRTLTRRKPNSRPPSTDVSTNNNNNNGSSSAEDTSMSSQASVSSTASSSASASCLSRYRGRSASVSSLSSAGSCCDAPIEWGTIKVFTDTIRADTDYKTLFVNTATNTHDLIRSVLGKFRLTHKDPKLFYLTMELRTRVHGDLYETTIILEDDARPLELQACHPREMSRFVLKMRPGALVRIHDHCINSQSNYKSVVISSETTTHETIALLLVSQREHYGQQASPDSFGLVSVDRTTGYEFCMPANVPLLSLVDESDLGIELHLRPFAHETSRSRSPSPPPVPFKRNALSSRAHRFRNFSRPPPLMEVTAQLEKCTV